MSPTPSTPESGTVWFFEKGKLKNRKGKKTPRPEPKPKGY